MTDFERGLERSQGAILQMLRTLRKQTENETPEYKQGIARGLELAFLLGPDTNLGI